MDIAPKGTRPYYTRWWYRQIVALLGCLNVLFVWTDLLLGDYAYAFFNGTAAACMFYLLWTTRAVTAQWWNK